MKNYKLDPEEQGILKAFEEGKLVPVVDVKKEMKRYRTMAKATIAKRRNINIRISEQDLVKIQGRALEEGLPYQTLIGSILHKYVHGTL